MTVTHGTYILEMNTKNPALTVYVLWEAHTTNPATCAHTVKSSCFKLSTHCECTVKDSK